MKGKLVGDIVRFTVRRGGQDAPRDDATVAGTGPRRRSSASSSSRPPTSTSRSGSRSTPATSAGRRPGSRSRSRCSRSSAGTSSTATRSRRPERSSRRLRRPDRRDQAEDDRRARGGCGRLPRPGRGKRARCPQVCARAADHPCEEFSTGVARAGNTVRGALETRRFGARNSPETARFPFRQAIIGAGGRRIAVRGSHSTPSAEDNA